MTINYVLMAVCGIFSIIGVYLIVKGGTRVRPFMVLCMIIVFFLAFYATIKGMTFYEMRYLIESKFR